MISVQGIKKSYDTKVALEGVSLDIEQGEILALVGINGAGKTTLLRMLAGVMIPDEGSITVDGKAILENIDFKKAMIFIPDDPFYGQTMTGDDVAALYKKMYTFDQETYLAMIQVFGLNPKNRIKTYSKGMRRRLFVCIALAVKPKYFFVDEVFDGLDPNARFTFKRAIQKLVKENQSTVIISSHSLRELEDVCNSYALIDGKHIHSHGSISQSLGNLFKFQIVFDHEVTKDELGFSVETFNAVGRVVTIACRGDKAEILKKINDLKPVMVDELEINFEEVFLANTKGGLEI